MVETFSPRLHLRGVTDIICHNNDDFYITEENKRIPVDNYRMFKKLLRQSSLAHVLINKEEQGVMVVWKSIGNNVPRHYIKFNVSSVNVADKLLTTILWNEFKPLYIKIKKSSPFMQTFKNKGFTFIGDRGNEVLLTLNNTFRKKYVNNSTYNKDSDIIE